MATINPPKGLHLIRGGVEETQIFNQKDHYKALGIPAPLVEIKEVEKIVTVEKEVIKEVDRLVDNPIHLSMISDLKEEVQRLKEKQNIALVKVKTSETPQVKEVFKYIEVVNHKWVAAGIAAGIFIGMLIGGIFK
jgi:hypothetical protein